MSGKSASRIMTVVLPRWPVQRQLLQQPGFREFPVFVCRKNARGVLSVVSWAWVMPPETRRGFQPVIQSGFSLSEALISKQPANSLGLFATTPIVCPSSRARPVRIFFAKSA